MLLLLASLTVCCALVSVVTRLEALERDGAITLYSEEAIRNWWALAATTCVSIARNLDSDTSAAKQARLGDLLAELSGVFDKIACRGRAATCYLTAHDMTRLGEAVKAAIKTAISLALPLIKTAVVVERMRLAAARSGGFRAVLQACAAVLRWKCEWVAS